jgi:hypothetical protein
VVQFLLYPGMLSLDNSSKTKELLSKEEKAREEVLAPVSRH